MTDDGKVLLAQLALFGGIGKQLQTMHTSRGSTRTLAGDYHAFEHGHQRVAANFSSDSLLQRTHFPGLNELRAIAILCVFPGHVEQLKSIFGLPYHYWFPVPGKLGVILFFVLSGFLVTALVLKEKERTGDVHLKNFYVRRVLRICPLYFALLSLSMFVFNRWQFVQMPRLSSSFYENLELQDVILLLLVLPNLSIPVPYAAHLWSIGIEAQFYLCQPLAVKLANSTLTLTLFLFGIVFLPEGLALVSSFVDVSEIARSQVPYFGCIAIGSIGAILCHRYPAEIRRFAHSNVAQATSLLVVAGLLFAINITGRESVVGYRIHALAFLVIIINASTNSNSFLNLRCASLDYLGRISYGMYIYHTICIGISIGWAEALSRFLSNVILQNVIIYAGTLALTVLVSSVSYAFFERYFLSLKPTLTAKDQLSARSSKGMTKSDTDDARLAPGREGCDRLWEPR